MITVRALMALGVDETSVYRRCRQGGPWQRLLPGIVLLHSGTPTRREREVAALLHAGDGAVLTGVAAARHHGLRRLPDDDHTVHVLVPAHRQVRSYGFVVVERTTRLPRPIERDALPVAPLVRAVLDEARRRRDPASIAALLAEPVQKRMLLVERLEEELEAGCRRGTAAPRAVLRALRAGVLSAAEFEARRWWLDRDLPPARFNVRLLRDGRLLGVVDVHVEEFGFAWEIDSVEEHFATPEQVEATARRRRLLRAAGLVVVAARPTQIRDDPDGVEQDVRDGLRVAELLPAPDVVAVSALDRES